MRGICGLVGFVEAVHCDSFCGSGFFFGGVGLFELVAGVQYVAELFVVEVLILHLVDHFLESEVFEGLAELCAFGVVVGLVLVGVGLLVGGVHGFFSFVGGWNLRYGAALLVSDRGRGRPGLLGLVVLLALRSVFICGGYCRKQGKLWVFWLGV